MNRLAWLNDLPEGTAVTELQRCCGAQKWATAVAKARPFASTSALNAAAEAAFLPMGRADWLEAFSHHPKIGETPAQAESGGPQAAAAAWSRAEQQGMDRAEAEVKDALKKGNVAYHDRFGYIFLICATGKSAQDMLAALNLRLRNDPESELQVAAAELRKITFLRLKKWLNT